MKIFGTMLVAVLALIAFDYHQAGGKHVIAFTDLAKRVGTGVAARL